MNMMEILLQSKNWDLKTFEIRIAAHFEDAEILPSIVSLYLRKRIKVVIKTTKRNIVR